MWSAYEHALLSRPSYKGHFPSEIGRLQTTNRVYTTHIGVCIHTYIYMYQVYVSQFHRTFNGCAASSLVLVATIAHGVNRARNER